MCWLYQSLSIKKSNWNNTSLKLLKYKASQSIFKFIIALQDSIDAHEYNNVSWFVYENYKTFKDINALNQAKEWSHKSYLILPEDIQINDTYAHILFEMGFVQDAIKYEEFAIKKGTEEKSNSVKFFTEELERFKKGGK